MQFSVSNSALLLIDLQPGMLAGINGIDRKTMMDRVLAAISAASLLQIPIIVATIDEAKNGKLLPEVQALIPKIKSIERVIPGFNALEDEKVAKKVKSSKRTHLFVIGWWSSMCCAFSALQAQSEGYQTHVLVDCIGDASKDAHKYAVQRMIQQGVQPVTAFAFGAGLMNNWTNPLAGVLVAKSFSRLTVA